MFSRHLKECNNTVTLLTRNTVSVCSELIDIRSGYDLAQIRNTKTIASTYSALRLILESEANTGL